VVRCKLGMVYCVLGVAWVLVHDWLQFSFGCVACVVVVACLGLLVLLWCFCFIDVSCLYWC